MPNCSGNIDLDRDALVALYNSTGGAGWKNTTNWLSGRPIGAWYGVTTNPAGRVIGLSLPGNALTGRIPRALGDLSSLKSLRLEQNRLAGSIPPELGNLSRLEVLSLSDNRLTGSIPAELGDLSELDALWLGGNRLTGLIPPALGNLSSLEILALDDNTLTGPLPRQLGRLYLRHFTISAGVCLPPSLRSWHFRIGYKTSITICGDAPSFGRQRVTDQNYTLGARIIDVYLPEAEIGDGALTYSLTPALPDGLHFDPSTRILSGTPTAPRAETVYTYAVRDADGDTAQLTFTITVAADREALIALYNATGGAGWKNRTNWLSDRPIDEWFGVRLETSDLLSFRATGRVASLDLSYNGLTGSLPPELGNLSKMTWLDLRDNQLTGPLPTELGALTSLVGLSLDGNPGLCLPPALKNWHGGIAHGDAIAACTAGGPAFGGRTVADLSFTTHQAIAGVTLPAATGGVGTLTYTLTPALPTGLSFDASTRVLSGAPTASSTAKVYTYTVRDAGGATARLTFTIAVTERVAASTDRAALVALYEATGGSGWTDDTHWLSERPIGEWFGVGTDVSGRVIDLHLDENGLTGRIPPQLAHLSRLQYLYLDGNRLTGAIPAELSNLSDLRAIDLANNRLTGPIPRELGRLSNLETLSLYRNRLTGPIPQELRNLPGLRSLITFETELCLPSGLESWHAGIWFRDILPACTGAPTFGDRTIADQAFAIGTPIAGLALPAAEGGDGVLTYALTPALPRGLDFDASTRVLTGTPTTTRTATVYTYTARDTVGDTAQLTFAITVRGTMAAGSDRDALVAFYNATGGASWKNDGGWLGDGPLSSWHGVATDASGRVTRLALADNGLIGALPAELGNLSRLDALYLYDNAGLTGPLPAGMGGLANLGSLYTFGTGLCLPPTLASWHAEIGARSSIGTCASPSGADRDALVALYNATGGASWRTRTNWLSDRPIGQWHGITTDGSGRVVKIHLLSNGLAGRLPPALGELSKLRTLWLASNRLRGAIPRETGDLRSLETLILSDNQLSGAIPSSLGTLPNLRYLFLSDNRLTGSIPPALGNLSRLVHLSLGENELTGPIPSALGKLRSLETLVLGNNRLAGQVPPQLGMLASLKILDLGVHDDGNGGITGPLPPELAKLTRVGRFNTYGTGLCLPSALASWHARIQDKDDMPRCGGVVGSDREALTALYNATGGANWTNNNGWLSDRPIGEWHGVTADRAGRVTRLALNSNGLAGTLPPELGGLSGLGTLYLHGNGGLTGSLPSEMRQLTGLSTLYTFGTGLCLPPSLADWHSAIGTKNTISACFAQETLPATRDAVQAALDEARAAADTAVVANGAAHAAAAAAFEFVAAAVEAAEAARDSAAAAAAAEDAANMAAEAARYAVAADAAATDAGVSADAAATAVAAVRAVAAVDAEAVASPAGEALLAEINELAAMAQANAAMAAAAAVDAATIAKDAADAADLAMAYAAGSAMLWVADAWANEGSDSAITFRVSVDPAASQPVTVDYATRDGTAKAGEDYTKTSGKLTFAAGETAKTVSVALLDDAKDEGEETFRLLLSKAKGAVIAGGEATGTIENDDPMPAAWLARFGRTVGTQVTDAVTGRLADGLAPGAHATLAGQALDLSNAEDGKALADAMTGLARAFGASEAPDDDGPLAGHGLGGGWDAPAATTAARSMTTRELLLGSAFHVAPARDGAGPGLAAWGRVADGRFDGEAASDTGSLRLDGEVLTGTLGADAEWERLLAGVAVSLSEGAGTFDNPGVDSGAVESTMTTVSPYLRLKLTERVSAWGLAGWGTGAMTMTQDAIARDVNESADTGPGRARTVTKTDLSMRMGAGGVRGALMEQDEAGGMDLALKADAFWTRTEWERVSGETDTAADASRVRLVLEGGRAFEVGGGATLRPSLELGLRHDGGDAETGAGLELGGGLSWTDPATGLSLEARARMLAAHADSGYEEWGASATARLDPGAHGRGLSFSLSPTLGASSSATERLWGAHDARGLAPDGEFDAARGLQAEAGYGLALFGGRFTGTPNAGFGLSDGGARDWRIGWRLTSAVPNDPGFEVNLDATRREPASDAEPEHGVMLRGGIRW